MQEKLKKFVNKSRHLVSGEAITFVGQMPLEGVFLELLIELLKPGTTLACVFPKTHLMARGLEAKTIRKLLLN